MPISPCTEVRLVHTYISSHCWDSAWLELARDLCMLSQLLWVHMSCYMWRTLFACIHPLLLTLTVFPHSLPQWCLSLGRIGCGTDVPFRAEYPESLLFSERGYIHIFAQTITHRRYSEGGHISSPTGWNCCQCLLEVERSETWLLIPSKY